MRIEYAYAAGDSWAQMVSDLVALICHGADALASLASPNRAMCSVVGAAPGVWYPDGLGFARADADGYLVSCRLAVATGAAVDGVYMMMNNADGTAPVSSVGVMIAGQNSAGGGLATVAGVVRVAVNEYAVAFSFPYATGRQLALIGEADGDFFGTGGAYPRGFAVGSQAVVAGGPFLDAVVRVPYFAKLKNHAAVGDKLGLSAAGLAFAASPSAAYNGYVNGVNDSLIYQALPLELWSNPKAAHLGFVRGVMMAPGKGVANDDFLTINGDEYVVFRENATAAFAIAMKA